MFLLNNLFSKLMYKQKKNVCFLFSVGTNMLQFFFYMKKKEELKRLERKIDKYIYQMVEMLIIFRNCTTLLEQLVCCKQKRRQNKNPLQQEYVCRVYIQLNACSIATVRYKILCEFQINTFVRLYEKLCLFSCFCLIICYWVDCALHLLNSKIN